MISKYGFYGAFGGQFTAETLIPALDRLEQSFRSLKGDPAFTAELDRILTSYAGRPTPVYRAENISKKYGFDLHLKREDLLHTGAHKINNTLGQILLAKSMGLKRVIAETGAGQHGVATATAAALYGLECEVYMGEIDAARQAVNVKKMELLGAKVTLVKEGGRVLKDAVSACLKDWVASFRDTHYLLGTVAGPHPFPEIGAWFHAVTGREARAYFEEQGAMPDVVAACVGGGSNAIGIFQGFLDRTDVRLIGVEAGGRSMNEGDHAAALSLGSKGIFQGAMTYTLQGSEGQIFDVHSVSAGLDYPGVGPEHSYLKDSGRAEYTSVDDREALNAFFQLTKLEGIFPALESSHALAYVMRECEALKGRKVLVNLSGRGDKDFEIVMKARGENL
jgi:tryptophan synthase beta chain